MLEFTTATPVRVRFAETDAQEIAHHSSYLVWLEAARIEYLERFAGGYPAIRERGIDALVLETHVRHLQPARFDDRLLVHSRCVDVRGARFGFEYAIERGGTVVADGWTTHALVDAVTLRPTRVPSWLAEAIAAAESSRSSSHHRPSSLVTRADSGAAPCAIDGSPEAARDGYTSIPVEAVARTAMLGATLSPRLPPGRALRRGQPCDPSRPR